MKYIRYCLLIIIFAVILSGETKAQVSKHSFRLRGLGENLFGFIDDLYSDLHINPAYISRFKKVHIYTNLSNLQSGDNYSVFKQNEQGYVVNPNFPSNMLGGIFKYKKYPIGIFLETSGYNVSTSYEDSGTDYLTTSNGVSNYHFKEFEGDFSAKSLTVFSKIQDWGIMVSYSNGGFSLGLNDKNRDSYFSISDTTGARMVNEQYYSNVEKKIEFPSSKFSLVAGKIFKKINEEYSFSVGFRPEKIKINSENLFSLFNEPFASMDSSDYSKFKDFDLGIVELGVRSIFLNLRYKKTFPNLKSFSQLNYLFNLTRYSLPININSTKVNQQDSLVVSGILPENIKDREESTVKSDGSAVVYKLMIGVGGERYFDDLRSMAAAGVKLFYLWGDVNLTQQPAEINETYYKTTDDPVNDIKYKNVISDERIIRTKGSGSALMISIPFGLETKIHDKFTLRFGASSWIPISFKGDWEIDTEDKPDSLVSSTSEDVTFHPEEIVPMFENRVAKAKGNFINLTTYHFGANYKISESIDIDLLHFARLTELDTWWLSINLKF